MTRRALIFSVAIFVSASLLFVAQLILGRLLLPVFGGTPAVWNTASVFYQAVLLAGYLWAHQVTTRLSLRAQLLAQAVVLALPIVALPFALPHGLAPHATSSPVPSLIEMLGVAAALPLFAISTSSPLLQRWFSRTRDPRAQDPYFLYAASNAGSLLGLAVYPLLIEPFTTLPEQARGWELGFFALAALALGCGAIALKDHRAAPQPAPTTAPASLAKKARWALLAAVPSSLMLSVTSYVSSDIVATPLLWALPLGLFLSSFIVAFSNRQWLPPEVWKRTLALTLVPTVMALAAELNEPLLLITLLHLGTFFVAAVVCHLELARTRPSVEQLTGFYLWVSVGGVLGGAFTALLAPLLFQRIAEYPLMLVAVAFIGAPQAAEARRFLRLDLVLPLLVAALTTALVFGLGLDSHRPSPAAIALAFGLPSLCCYFFSRRQLRFALSLGAVLLVSAGFAVGQGRVIFSERSFFGVHRVTEDSERSTHRLLHGHTVHGVERLDAAHLTEPLGYYHREGPLGRVFAALDRSTTSPAAVIGLGAGAIASYGGPGQSLTFYEIDSAVRDIASDAHLFHYLERSPAKVNIVLGDARRSLETAADGAYRLIILDAYSSDSIPVHLLTREALQLYLRKLEPEGVLVFHISNRHLRLRPVLARLASDLGLAMRTDEEAEVSPQALDLGRLPSQWAVLARSDGALRGLATDPRWQPDEPSPALRPWTDDYSSVVQVLDLDTW